MSDQLTYVEVATGGGIFSGDSIFNGNAKVSVQYAANQAARAFAITATDSPVALSEAWGFMPGEPVTITANGQLMLAGYVDIMSPSFDKNNHHVEISGRSKGADAVNSSVEHHSNEFLNMTPLAIMQAIDKQNIGFTTDIAQPLVDYFRINPGETVFAAGDRLTRKYQMLLQGMPDGGIKLTTGATAGTNAPLIQGENILAASAAFDQTNGHSSYTVRGQKSYGHDRKALQIKQSAKDKTVKRNRPKHIHQEGDIDDDTALKRAKHQRDRQQGESISATIKSQSWFDSNGELWRANGLVYVYCPMLKIDMQMLIKSVNLSIYENGSFADVLVTLPQTFGGKGTGMGGASNTGSKSAPQWTVYDD